MTDLRSALERYLNMRQGLGYKYQHQARRLADFVSFMETRCRSAPAHARSARAAGAPASVCGRV